MRNYANPEISIYMIGEILREP